MFDVKWNNEIYTLNSISRVEATSTSRFEAKTRDPEIDILKLCVKFVSDASCEMNTLHAQVQECPNRLTNTAHGALPIWRKIHSLADMFFDDVPDWHQLCQ